MLNYAEMYRIASGDEIQGTWTEARTGLEYQLYHLQPTSLVQLGGEGGVLEKTFVKRLIRNEILLGVSQ